LEIYTNLIFSSDDIVEVRAIRGSKDDVKKHWYYAKDLPAAYNELISLNEDGYNIYAGPNPRKGFNVSGDYNVIHSRLLFADFDGINPPPELSIGDFVKSKLRELGLPVPTLLINSGHGVHTYWVLDRPLTDLKIWKTLMQRLVSTLDSDRAVVNPERIMRLPGFKNLKKEPITEVCIIESNPSHIYGLEEIEKVLLPLTENRDNRKVPPKLPDTSEQTILRAKLYASKWGEIKEGERNNIAYQRAAALREKFDLDQEVVTQIILEKNYLNKPPMNEDEIRQVVADAFKYAKSSAGEGLNRDLSTIKPIKAFRTFPTHVFPDPIRGFVTVTAKSIGCDPSYVALPLLSALATAIGNGWQIKLKDGWTEPCIIWTVIIGE
jgi:hypothetical protein